MTTIIIDMSQIMFANIFRSKLDKKDIEIDFIRHMCLTSILFYKNKFKTKNIILAFDNKKTWRKEYFSYYKARRKSDREKNKKTNYDDIFAIINTLKEEFKQELPFIGVEVPGAEADDIIAVLTKQMYNTNDVVIVSSDHDYCQLQIYDSVKQFKPVQKMFAERVNPSQYLIEHIIKGETGDGIPNILSADNCLADGIKQKSITADLLAKLSADLADLDNPKFNHCTTENFQRNRILVDFSQIPETISINIISEYELQKNTQKTSLYNYFYKNNLKTLMERINEYTN